MNLNEQNKWTNEFKPTEQGTEVQQMIIRSQFDVNRKLALRSFEEIEYLPRHCDESTKSITKLRL